MSGNEDIEVGEAIDIEDLADCARAIPNCKICSWSKFCIEPPTMTKEDVEAKIRDLEREARGDPEKSAFSMLMGTMIFGGRDRECLACPIFIQRLRASPKLMQKIKEIMQTWEES